jgi:predicted acetyltransferase
VIVAVAPAEPDEMPIVHHFFVAFFYDLSQYDDNLGINDYGLPLWEPSGRPGPRTPAECVTFNWWIRDRCLPYILRADGNPAGYAMVCADKAHLPEDVDFDLLDFYIAPKYRRHGVGREAARLLFDRHRGAWQVFELARNAPALAFWHRVIDEYTGGHYADLDGGTQQRFSNV